MGKDGTGLGRRTWIRIEGNNEIKTTVITVYSPCKPRKHGYYSTFAQQKGYWTINGIKECSRENFRKYPLEFIKLCKYKEDKIILMLDGNENIHTRKLTKALNGKPYNMIDITMIKVGNLRFRMCNKCQEQIDAIWISKDLEATKATVLPFF